MGILVAVLHRTSFSHAGTFPACLYTLSLSQVCTWLPFTALLLAAPLLAAPPPAAVTAAVAWLGYAQAAATPALICLMHDRAREERTRGLIPDGK